MNPPKNTIDNKENNVTPVIKVGNLLLNQKIRIQNLTIHVYSNTEHIKLMKIHFWLILQTIRDTTLILVR